MKAQQVCGEILLTLALGHCFPDLDPDIVFTGRAMERAKEIDSKCRAEAGAGDDSFALFITGEEVAESNHPFKCFVKCLMNQLNSLDEGGNFSLDEEMLNVPPQIKQEGERIINACGHKFKGPDHCEVAYKIHRCYHNENPELYTKVVKQWEYRALN